MNPRRRCALGELEDEQAVHVESGLKDSWTRIHALAVEEVQVGLDASSGMKDGSSRGMFSVFLQEESGPLWFPWGVDASGDIVEAEARVSQQNKSTEHYVMGRARFTGKFRGIKISPRTLGTVSRTYSDVVYDQRLVANPCYYEGDLDKASLIPKSGEGAFMVGPDCREVYRGRWSAVCRTANCDEEHSGAASGSSFGKLYDMYIGQKNIFLRGWMNAPQDGRKSATTHVEVRCADGGDTSACMVFSTNGVLALPNGDVVCAAAITVGDRVVSVPPKMLAWIVHEARPPLPWIGATHLRPSSVVACDRSDLEGVSPLLWTTDWAPAEGIYAHGEAIVLRHDMKRGPSRVLHLGFGAFDGDPERHEATVVTEHGDVARGLTHKFPWSDLLQAKNAVAVMCSPTALCRDTTIGLEIDAPWSEGSNGECLVFFTTVPDHGSVEMSRSELAYTFSGRPVVMDPAWVKDRFPDQYAVAETCPNMPVSLEPMRSQTPVFNPRVMQLMCPAVLADLESEDSRTGFVGMAVSVTPGSVSMPRSCPRWVSLLWPLCQRDLRLGFAPVTWQVLLYGFGDRGFISQYSNRGQFPPPYQLTSREHCDVYDCLLRKKPILFKKHVPGPARIIGADQYGGRNNPYWYLCDSPPGLVVKKGRCIWNLSTIMYVKGSGKTPYVLTFGLQQGTRTKHIDRGKYGQQDYCKGFAVSATYLRTYYHPLVLQMAVLGIWDSDRFAEAAEGGSSIIKPTIAGVCVRATAPDMWEHFTAKDIGRVGAHSSGEGGACCLRGAVRAALESYSTPDDGVLGALSDWPEWSAFGSVPGLVEALTSKSTANRRYRAVAFKQLGKGEGAVLPWASGGVAASPATARCAFTLILSPQGRSRLLQVGVDRVIFRPWTAAGWKSHAMAAVARTDGQWYLLDPAAGGVAHKSTILHGAVPGVEGVIAAYALVVAGKKRKGAPASELRQLVKTTLKNGDRLFCLPEPPTLLEARRHQEGACMDFAFRAWVGVVGEPNSFNWAIESRSLMGPVRISCPPPLSPPRPPPPTSPLCLPACTLDGRVSFLACRHQRQ